MNNTLCIVRPPTLQLFVVGGYFFVILLDAYRTAEIYVCNNCFQRVVLPKTEF